MARFVLNSKFVELPKGVIGGSLPSVVRLQPLDNCFRVWMDALKHVIEFCRVLCGEGRESRLPLDIAQQWRSLVGQGKFEGEVVERGTKVVYTVADDDAKFGSGRRYADFDPKEFLRAINIVGFTPSLVRVFLAPGVKFLFKALQVVARPV